MKELKPGDLAMWCRPGEDNLPVTILEMEDPVVEPCIRVVQVLVEGEVDVVYLRDLVPCVDGDAE